jgi:hypothetical protein
MTIVTTNYRPKRAPRKKRKGLPFAMQAAVDERRHYDEVGIKHGLTLQCEAAEKSPD